MGDLFCRALKKRLGQCWTHCIAAIPQNSAIPCRQNFQGDFCPTFGIITNARVKILGPNCTYVMLEVLIGACKSVPPVSTFICICDAPNTVSRSALCSFFKLCKTQVLLLNGGQVSDCIDGMPLCIHHIRHGLLADGTCSTVVFRDLDLPEVLKL